MIGEIIIAVTVMIVVLIAIASIIFAIVETMERINPKLTWLIFPFFSACRNHFIQIRDLREGKP